MVDTLSSGGSVSNDVRVRISHRAQINTYERTSTRTLSIGRAIPVFVHHVYGGCADYQ